MIMCGDGGGSSLCSDCRTCHWLVRYGQRSVSCGHWSVPQKSALHARCRAQHRARPLKTRRPLIPNCIFSGGGHVPLATADRARVTCSCRGALRGAPGGESITLSPPTPFTLSSNNSHNHNKFRRPDRFANNHIAYHPFHKQVQVTRKSFRPFKYLFA